MTDKWKARTPPTFWSRVERIAKYLAVITAIGGALVAGAHYALAAASTANNVATKQDLAAAVAAHAAASADSIALAPVVQAIQQQLAAHAQRLATVEATSDDNARDLDWIKSTLFQVAQRQHLGVDAPPARRRPPPVAPREARGGE